MSKTHIKRYLCRRVKTETEPILKRGHRYGEHSVLEIIAFFGGEESISD